VISVRRSQSGTVSFCCIRRSSIMQKPSNIGGQAVLEGIMMRFKDDYAIAVRKSDGDIVVKKEKYRNTIPIRGIEKIPILRGVSAFIDSLVVGVSCLMYSSEFYDEETPDSERKEKDEQWERSGEAKIIAEDPDRKSSLGKGEMALTVFLAAGLTIGLFILLPYFLASILRRFGASEVAVSLTEALLRFVIFFGYMIMISKMKDIQRVFMYHGAEHKCINCLEHGLELNVENVMVSSRQHKRCGTSFMLFVVVVSAVFFLIIGLLGITSPLLRFGLRLLFIPVIAGVSYEIIRLAGSSENPCVLILSKPGLMLQKLVTREPDEAQVEVAIAAVDAVFDWRGYLAENFPS